MATVKFTKNELKKQKDALKRFQRYLPTLILKKQQLQLVIRQVETKEAERVAEKEKLYSHLQTWIKLFGEEIDLEDLIQVKEIKTSTGNIAGVDIPIFESAEFEEVLYDLFQTPLWVDRAIEAFQEFLTIDAEIIILKEQIRRLSEELRITSQRVNLFEKVKIPETKNNIRMIKIYLGDQQTAAVVRGKISKNKLTKVS